MSSASETGGSHGQKILFTITSCALVLKPGGIPYGHLGLVHFRIRLMLCILHGGPLEGHLEDLALPEYGGTCNTGSFVAWQ